nr:cation:proton antiporter [Candidatus Saccharibacteria bacterium]
MHSSLLGELSIIIAIAVLLATIMKLLKQPLIIGYILAGIIAGPILGLVNNADTLEGFSKIGIALLLFIVGMGLNPRIIKELGRVTLITGFVQVATVTIIGTSLMMLFGASFITSIIVGVSLAFSSTIVGLKLLSDKKEQTRLYGRIAIGVLLVQDLVATLALLVLSMQEDGFGIFSSLSLVLRGGFIVALLFYMSTKVLPRLTRFMSENTEYLFLFTIAWG